MISLTTSKFFHDFNKKNNPGPEIPLNLRAGISIYFKYRGLYFQFHPPLVQDYIQRQMEYQPDGNVYAQDIRDVDIPYQRHVDQDKHQREQTDAYHHLSHFQPTSQQLVVDMVLVRQERVLLVSQPVAHHSHHVEQRHQHGGKRQHHVIVAHGTGMHIHRTQVNHQEADDISQRQRSRITHEELPAPHLVSKHIIIPERDDHTQSRDTEQGIGENFSNCSSYLSSA